MWKREYGLTRADDRRQALLENDVLVAIGLGVSIDALCLAYRDNFGVLKRYDLAHHYDANGRLVPKEVLKLYKIKGDHLTPEERTSAYLGSGVDYTYEFPFEILDREQDMRDAYASFEQEFGHSE